MRRMSKDTKVLISLIVLLTVGAYFIAVRPQGKEDKPSSYGTGKRGTKAFYILLKDLGFRVGRHEGSIKTIPKSAKVLFLVDPLFINEPDAKPLTEWVERGNTLIIAVSRSAQLPDDFGIISIDRFNELPAFVQPEDCKYKKGVKRLFVTARTAFNEGKDGFVIVKQDEDAVVIEKPLGKGRIIAIGDPLLVANSQIRDVDNVVLITNLVYENAGENDGVFFWEYDPLAGFKNEPPPLLDLGGWLALGELTLVTLLILISIGRRFGAIHPLPEWVEQPRGWELVRAMAGLYHRAEARGIAMKAIYASFRRELIVKFGVSPDASPDDAAETVFRARQVDKARLTALLSRCENIAKGQETSDSEVISLTKSIEEFRRELGIARSTKN